MARCALFECSLFYGRTPVFIGNSQIFDIINGIVISNKRRKAWKEEEKHDLYIIDDKGSKIHNRGICTFKVPETRRDIMNKGILFAGNILTDQVKMITDYRNRYNATVLIISHNMEDMALIADKLIVMNKGEMALFDTDTHEVGIIFIHVVDYM